MQDLRCGQVSRAPLPTIKLPLPLTEPKLVEPALWLIVPALLVAAAVALLPLIRQRIAGIDGQRAPAEGADRAADVQRMRSAAGEFECRGGAFQVPLCVLALVKLPVT